MQSTDRDITILGAGSLIALKQYDIFIDAVKEIIKEIPAAKCNVMWERAPGNAIAKINCASSIAK